MRTLINEPSFLIDEEVAQELAAVKERMERTGKMDSEGIERIIAMGRRKAREHAGLPPVAEPPELPAGGNVVLFRPKR